MTSEKGFAQLVVVIAAAVVGVVIGVFWGPSLRTRIGVNPSLTAPTKEADLRSDLEAVQRENVFLVMAVTRRVFDGDSYTDDAIKALDDNAEDVGDIIGRIYGLDVRKEYVQLWKNQNTHFVNYATALRNGDKAAREKAITDLDGYVEATVTFWGKVNPNVETLTYRQLAVDRVNLEKSAIEAYAARNIARSYRQQHVAYGQIGKAADLLASGISKQFPGKYK